MARGDHVYVDRYRGLYNHHGIDCGDGTVIHYTSRSWQERRRIERTDIDRFCRGDALHVRDYSEFEKTLSEADRVDKVVQRASRELNRLLDRLQGIGLDELDLSDDAVIGRAESRLGESRFDLVYNNCEHFAAWCKTGISGSRQIESVWRASLSQPRFMTRQTQTLLTRMFD